PIYAGRPAGARRGRLHLHHGGRRREHRPRGVPAEALRAGLLRRPEGPGHRAAAGGGRAVAHRVGGHHRHPPHRPVRAAGGGPVGRGDLPPPPHDRAHGDRRLSAVVERAAPAEPSPAIERFLAAGSPPTPFLVLDPQVVADRYARLTTLLPGADVHFAVKACPHPEVLR